MQHLQQRVMMAPGSFAPGARKDGEDGDGLGEQVATLEGPPPPPSRTKLTRLVHPSVLTGHVWASRGRSSTSARGGAATGTEEGA